MRQLDVLTILCGQGGLNASKSPSLVREIDLISMDSLAFEHDTWEKEGGASKFNSAAISSNPSVIAIHEFVTGTGTQELVAVTGDGRYLVLGTGGVSKTMFTGAGTDKHTVMVEGWNGTTKALFFYNGNIPVREYIGGANTTELLSQVGAFTADHTTETFSFTAHGLTNGTAVQVSNTGGALPTGLAIDTEYYIISATANTFQLSATVGGGAINITDNGTGTHFVHKSLRPSDWVTGKPAWAFQHLGRMFAGGNSNQPHGVYASVNNKHNDFINAGTQFYLVYPGEGERIVGGISWREKNYIFKYPRGIYRLQDESTDPNVWGYRRISKYVGCVGPSAIVESDDEVYFVSPYGFIHALSAVQEHGDVMSSAILPMELGTYIRENVNFTRLARVASAYYAKKRRIVFGFSSPASTVNDLMIGLDIHRQAAGGSLTSPHTYQPFVSRRDECQSLATYRDSSSQQQLLLAGTNGGYVYQLDTEARNKDGMGYLSRFETKDLDLYPNGVKNGNLRELEIVFVPTGNWSIDVKVYRDGNLGDPITFTQIGNAGILDSFILDTSVLGGDVLVNGRGRLYGDARRVRLAGENTIRDESFSVASMMVKYVPGNVK